MYAGGLADLTLDCRLRFGLLLVVDWFWDCALGCGAAVILVVVLGRLVV